MTVREDWESFWKAVAPVDAPAIQKQEMRRAFMAGAWSMLQTVKAIGANEVSEDQGVAILEALEQELRDFRQQVVSGKA